jgi:hypothetical protein
MEHINELQTTRNEVLSTWDWKRTPGSVLQHCQGHHIVQQVQKTYKNGQDTAVSPRDLKVKDLNQFKPTRGSAVATDATENLQEQRGMDIIYQAELERYLERKDTLEQNLTKAYALIFSTYILQQDDAELYRRVSRL